MSDPFLFDIDFKNKMTWVRTRVENNHYFLDTMVGYGYGYRPFEKSYGWLWLGYITILTIIIKITVLTIITIITIITINGLKGSI